MLTRRKFLAWLGLAPVVGPQVVKAAMSAAPAVAPKVVSIGAAPLAWQGVPVIVDKYAPTGVMYLMNTKYWRVEPDAFEYMKAVDAAYERGETKGQE